MSKKINRELMALTALALFYPELYDGTFKEPRREPRYEAPVVVQTEEQKQKALSAAEAKRERKRQKRLSVENTRT